MASYYISSKQVKIRTYKRKKSKQLREVRRALSNLHDGCAYLPDGAHIEITEMRRILECVEEKCKVWLRKAEG